MAVISSGKGLRLRRSTAGSPISQRVWIVDRATEGGPPAGFYGGLNKVQSPCLASFSEEQCGRSSKAGAVIYDR